MSTDIIINGKWKNQYNSVMEIKAHADGRITGTFQTAIGRPTFDEKFELTGKINKETIAFIVDFAHYGSIACWTGRITEDLDGEAIHSLWHLSQSEGGDEEKYARAILTGVGTFHRI